LFCDISLSIIIIDDQFTFEPSKFIEILNFVLQQLNKEMEDMIIIKALKFLNEISMKVFPSMSPTLSMHSSTQVLQSLLKDHPFTSEIYGLSVFLVRRILNSNIIGMTKPVSDIILQEIFDQLDKVLQSKSLVTTNGELIYSELIKILIHLGDDTTARAQIISNIPLENLVSLARVITAKNVLSLSALVDLYIYLYSPIFKSKNEILFFTQIVLDQLADLVTVSNFAFVKGYSLIIKKFTIMNEYLFHWVELSTATGILKAALIEILEILNFEVGDASLCLIDALNALFGWREVCWSPPEVLYTCCSTRESIAKVAHIHINTYKYFYSCHNYYHKSYVVA
jgi:hypothetical protein